MKANEAPEKIYRTTFYLDDDKGDTKWKKTPVAGAENIEYVRKDAFIEKVCKYLQENCTYTHPRKGTPICAVNLTLLKEYLEDRV